MCKVAAAYRVKRAARVVRSMILAGQHRGQDGAGIAAFDGKHLDLHKDYGLVEEVFKGFDFRRRLRGDLAIGQTRYATTGSTFDKSNLQPLRNGIRHIQMAIAHNGNIPDYDTKRWQLEEDGAFFQTTSDSELLWHEMWKSGKPDPLEALIEACRTTEISFSIVVICHDRLVAARDARGFRPLYRAKLGEGWLVASETCAFDLFKDQGVGEPIEIEPGTAVIFGPKGPEIRRFARASEERRCIFEDVYLSRPDSRGTAVNHSQTRKRFARLLAKRFMGHANLVVPVPDSGNHAALEVSKALGIPFGFGLIRNHYTGRQFITPIERDRKIGIRMKLNVDADEVRGKRVIVVDDSIVRSDTIRQVVAMLIAAGALEVHVLIASPRIIHPCHWGIATRTFDELIAFNHETEEIRRMIGATSLTYLEISDLLAAVDDVDGKRHCRTCFTGVAPTVNSRLTIIRD